MLSRSHVAPFLRLRGGMATLSYLADDGERVVPFLDRLCRLVRRLEGRARATVVEALRRQERRVRDAARMAGLAKTLLDACEFRSPPGSERAGEFRRVVFRARGERWPPVPGDRMLPYEEAARVFGLPAGEVEHLLYADAPGARLLVRATRMTGRALLAHYNLELARAVLLDAERLTISARGGWRGIFRAVKRARLMHVVRRVGRSYEVELTGPAAPYVVRASRYGARLARVIPAVARAPHWRLQAEVRLGDELVRFEARGRSRAGPGVSPVGARAARATYDSAWERSLADDFRRRFAGGRDGWTLARETTPVAAGDELFLPDFTLRHSDGREALVEIVGFWTPEYLEAKARKMAAAGLDHLIVVVYRGLAVGAALDALVASGADRLVWFADRPRAAPVLAMAERVAR